MTRHKKQPTAEVMREQLRLAADEIIRQRVRVEYLLSANDARIAVGVALLVGLLLGWVTA